MNAKTFRLWKIFEAGYIAYRTQIHNPPYDYDHKAQITAFNLFKRWLRSMKEKGMDTPSIAFLQKKSRKEASHD